LILKFHPEPIDVSHNTKSRAQANNIVFSHRTRARPEGPYVERCGEQGGEIYDEPDQLVGKRGNMKARRARKVGRREEVVWVCSGESLLRRCQEEKKWIRT